MATEGEVKPTTVRLDPELRAAIEILGQREERNFSQQVSYILKRYLAAEHPELLPGAAKKKGGKA